MSTNGKDDLAQMRQEIRNEYLEKAKTWAEKKVEPYKERVAYLERELAKLQKTIHDEFMAAAMANSSIVTKNMSATDAARTCLRYADCLVKARRIDEGDDESKRGF